MKLRLKVGLLGLTLFGMVLVLSAGEQTKQTAPSTSDREELAAREQQLARQVLAVADQPTDALDRDVDVAAPPTLADERDANGGTSHRDVA